MQYLKEIDDLWKANFPNIDVPGLMNSCGDYGVLNNPKPILSTVTPVTNAQGEIIEYLVEIEIPQPAFSDEMIKNEILKAKPTEPLDQQPMWYKGMSYEEKLLFDYTMKDIHDIEGVRKNFAAISSRHRTIPGVANHSKHVSARIDLKNSFEIARKNYKPKLTHLISSSFLNKLPGNKAMQKRINDRLQNFQAIINNPNIDVNEKIYRILKQPGKTNKRSLKYQIVITARSKLRSRSPLYGKENLGDG